MSETNPEIVLTRPAIQRLEAWMTEVTDLLCYQPEVPLAHKTCLVDAMQAFVSELDFIDKKRQKTEMERLTNTAPDQ